MKILNNKQEKGCLSKISDTNTLFKQQRTSINTNKTPPPKAIAVLNSPKHLFEQQKHQKIFRR